MDQIESFQCTTKIKSFPVVNSTCFWLTENYSKLRESNFITKTSCGIAETTLKSSIYLASPIVNKFKDQVNSLDSIACDQLDRLETAFPCIKKETEDLMLQSKELINKTVGPVSNRYNLYKKNTCETMKRLNKHTLTNQFFDLSEKILEKYLIYSDLEKKEDEELTDYIQAYREYKLDDKRYQKLLRRIKVLTYVFLYAMKANFLKHASHALELLAIKFKSLYIYLEMFHTYKYSLVNRTTERFELTKEKIILYKEYLEVLSNQLTVQDGRSLHNIQSVEERTKIVIRRSLGNMIAAFHLVSSKVLNVVPFIQSRFNTLGQFIADLYHIYNKHDGSFNEMLVDTILREVGECTYKTQCSVDLFLKNLNNSAIVTWFVPNFETFGVLYYEYEDMTISKQPEPIIMPKSLASSEAELANVFPQSLDCTFSSDISCQYSENSAPNVKANDHIFN